MSNKLPHFKSPGFYTQEQDITTIYVEDFKVFCKECLKQHRNTFEDELYCFTCGKET